MPEAPDTKVRVQAIAPADFPKAFEAFERLPSGKLGKVEFSRELDFFVEEAAANVGLPAVDDTVVNADPSCRRASGRDLRAYRERRTSCRWRICRSTIRRARIRTSASGGGAVDRVIHRTQQRRDRLSRLRLVRRRRFRPPERNNGCCFIVEAAGRLRCRVALLKGANCDFLVTILCRRANEKSPPDGGLLCWFRRSLFRLGRNTRGLGIPLLHGGLAAELDAALVVDADAFHPDRVADFHDVFGSVDTEVRKLGDVAKAVLSGEDLNEGTELLGGDDRALV